MQEQGVPPLQGASETREGPADEPGRRGRREQETRIAQKARALLFLGEDTPPFQQAGVPGRRGPAVVQRPESSVEGSSQGGWPGRPLWDISPRFGVVSKSYPKSYPSHTPRSQLRSTWFSGPAIACFLPGSGCVWENLRGEGWQGPRKASRKAFKARGSLS